MIEAAHAVILHNKRIGSILQRGDVARFVFEDGYWEDPTRDVLGLWFEDDPRRSPQAAGRLPPWFSNLLPEGPLREWIARDQGVSAARELQLLLRIGTDLPGAVQVLPAPPDERFDSELLSESRQDAPRTSRQRGQWKFSLAGVSLKFSLLKQNERLTMPASDAIGDWIVKLPDARHREVPVNEFATMDLARAAGIDVPEIALLHRDELPSLPDDVWPHSEDRAFAIARFDRGPNGDRIHIEDLAQVRGIYDDDKYQGSFETVAALLFRNHDLAALREFVRRLTFNILIANGDAHLKNWSLIYPDRRIPTLSPAYDLVSTGAYAGDHEPDDIGLKFGGTRIYERISRESFRQLQRKLRVSEADVLEVVDDTIELVTAEWTNARENFPGFVAVWVDGHMPRMVSRLTP